MATEAIGDIIGDLDMVFTEIMYTHLIIMGITIITDTTIFITILLTITTIQTIDITIITITETTPMANVAIQVILPEGTHL